MHQLFFGKLFLSHSLLLTLDLINGSWHHIMNVREFLFAHLGLCMPLPEESASKTSCWCYCRDFTPLHAAMSFPGISVATESCFDCARRPRNARNYVLSRLCQRNSGRGYQAQGKKWLKSSCSESLLLWSRNFLVVLVALAPSRNRSSCHHERLSMFAPTEFKSTCFLKEVPGHERHPFLPSNAQPVDNRNYRNGRSESFYKCLVSSQMNTQIMGLLLLLAYNHGRWYGIAMINYPRVWPWLFHTKNQPNVCPAMSTVEPSWVIIIN